LVAVPTFRGNYEQIINGLRTTALLRALAAGSLLLALALSVLTLVQLRATRADKAGERAR